MNGTMTKESNFVKSRAKLFACRSEEEVTTECSKNKTPSYVSLSCAISGYSALKYDTRTRDSSRDRPALPLCMTRSRESSPSPIKVGSNHRQSSGFALDVTDNATVVHHIVGQSRSKSVDRGYLRQSFLNGHSAHQGNNKPPPGGGGVSMTYKTTFSTMVNGDGSSEGRGRVRIRSSTVPHDINQKNSKSFVQERIERLYGPAALARGFFLVKSPMKAGSGDQKEPVNGIPLNNNNNITTNSPSSQAGHHHPECATPPVFRHLNPEFRQQLSLKKRSPSIEHSNNKSPVIAKETAPASPEPAVLNNKSSIESPATPVTPVTNGVQPSVDDGNKFLRIMDEEKTRIECQIAKFELYLLDPNVSSSEELTGKIRAATGKARLLLAQKFEQFAGLCRKNLTQSPGEPFPTTGEDLAGFWDMVTIQVDHIKSLFAEIQRLRDNGWAEPEEIEIKTPVVKNPKKSRATPAAAASTPARSAKAEEAAKARNEARRKMMEEKRKLMKAKKDEETDNWAVIAEKQETNPADEDPTVI